MGRHTRGNRVGRQPQVQRHRKPREGGCLASSAMLIGGLAAVGVAVGETIAHMLGVY